MKYLENKVAMVTGGAKGMGAAICLKFAEEGCAVVVNDLDGAGAGVVADEIVSKGGAAVSNRVDQTDKSAVDAVTEETIKRFGKIDILVNNAGGVAGMNGVGPSGTFTMDEWQRILNINLNGPLHYMLAVIPHMKKANYGKIINFSSIGAFTPTVSVLPYHAAKGAIESLTMNLAFELSRDNINVNVIVPGNIRTPFWDNVVIPTDMTRDEFFDEIVKRQVPLRKMGASEDVAGAALYLASGMSDFVSGQRLYVAGGCPNVLTSAVLIKEDRLS
ncbi:MAG: SDR family oxidoreductase [Oscillospiraceae bacterium]|nr:SDR family oxidoreductase [Oscillospiraceae bacterium]